MTAANTKNDSFQKEVIIIIIKRNLCNEGYKEVSLRYKFTEKRQEHETFIVFFIKEAPEKTNKSSFKTNGIEEIYRLFGKVGENIRIRRYKENIRIRRYH